MVGWEGGQGALAVLAAPDRQRGPEYGSIEGHILAALNYYNSPAVRVRNALTREEMVCVFDKNTAPEIGAGHTLDEVWTGQRVLVSGRIDYDKAGNAHVMRAEAMRVMPQPRITAGQIATLMGQDEVVPPDEWGTPH